MICSDAPDVPLVINEPSQHTMATSLGRYVQTRVHEYVDDRTYKRIAVFGSYNRSLAVSRKEKRDKRENWQRPTACIRDETLEIHCYPGRAYAYHYASLIATHLKLTGRDHSIVNLSLPAPEACRDEIARAGFDKIRPTNSLVVASGNDFLAPVGSVWDDCGTFEVRVSNHRASAITWLAVKHSFWGDIAFHLGHALAATGFERIVFVGKLGSLVPEHQPNITLATGSSSCLAGENVVGPTYLREMKDRFSRRAPTSRYLLCCRRQWSGAMPWRIGTHS